MPAWRDAVQEIPNEVQREALLFCLLSALRRNSLVELQWKDLDLNRRCIRIGKPKGGQERAFDLILSRAMLRCLWRARRASRKQHGAHADTWVFASAVGHVRGDSLTRHGVLANHALRRAYATAATNAGVDEDTVGKLLNHGGRSVTARYIRRATSGECSPLRRRTSARISSRRLGRVSAGRMPTITAAVEHATRHVALRRKMLVEALE